MRPQKASERPWWHQDGSNRWVERSTLKQKRHWKQKYYQRIFLALKCSLSCRCLPLVPFPTFLQTDRHVPSLSLKCIKNFVCSWVRHSVKLGPRMSFPCSISDSKSVTHLLTDRHVPSNFPFRCLFFQFLVDVIASPRTYPCQSVGGSVSEWLIGSDLEIAIASPSFASLFVGSLVQHSVQLVPRMSMDAGGSKLQYKPSRRPKWRRQ